MPVYTFELGSTHFQPKAAAATAARVALASKAAMGAAAAASRTAMTWW